MKGKPAAFARSFFAPFDAGFASPRLRAMFRVLCGALVFFFPFRVVSMSFDLLPASLSWIASVSIAMHAMLIVLSELRAEKARVVFSVFAGIAALVFTVEWVGVRSGVPFGPYRYTQALGGLIDGVPVAIVLAWYALVISPWRMSRALVQRVPQGFRRIGVPLSAGALMLLLDAAMEPVAAFMKDYWLWDAGSVPLSNYASWFALSAFVAAALDAGFSARERVRDPRTTLALLHSSALVFLMQLALFACTSLAGGFVLEASIALVMTVLLAAWFFTMKSGPVPARSAT